MKKYFSTIELGKRKAITIETDINEKEYSSGIIYQVAAQLAIEEAFKNKLIVSRNQYLVGVRDKQNHTEYYQAEAHNKVESSASKC